MIIDGMNVPFVMEDVIVNAIGKAFGGEPGFGIENCTVQGVSLVVLFFVNILAPSVIDS